MAFTIVRNDITRMHADAIVNPANPDPIVGRGTDSAIHHAAGPELLRARQQLGAIAVGECRETPAFGLSARYVLHTVGPVWIDGRHGEAALLYRAYTAALTLAQKLHCRSVAMPLLSSGHYGFPPEQALSVAIRAFTDFLLANDMQLVLVVFDDTAFSLAGSLFDGVKSYVDEHYVSARIESEYGEDALCDQAPNRSEEASAPLSDRRKATYGTASLTSARKAAPLQAPKGAASFAAASDDLNELLNTAESGFSEYLSDLLKESGEKDSAVYRRAQISRQLFHRIMTQKNYQPTKSTAIQLALALRLDLAGTQKLLSKAGYSLTRSSKTDLVVQYFIERKEYSIVAINAALYDCGLPLLKTGSVL